MREPAGDNLVSRSALPRSINGGCHARRAAALSALAEMDAPYICADPQEIRIRASAEGLATVARAIEAMKADLPPVEG